MSFSLLTQFAKWLFELCCAMRICDADLLPILYQFSSPPQSTLYEKRQRQPAIIMHLGNYLIAFALNRFAEISPTSALNDEMKVLIKHVCSAAYLRQGDAEVSGPLFDETGYI